MGQDTILLPSNSTFTLTEVNNNGIPYSTPYGPTGLPVIESVITIQGNGSTIERSAATGTPKFRLFAINSSGNLTLQQTTITGGHISPVEIVNYGHVSGGGGIANSGGTLTLTGSTVSDNVAAFGGGVHNYNDGTAIITNSTISGNMTFHSGGGVRNSGGTMTLTYSTIAGNIANTPGGGVVNIEGGILTLTNSTVSGNSAGSYGFGAGGIATLRWQHHDNHQQYCLRQLFKI